METTLAVAAVLVITALAASMVSVELGLSVAVIEILAGILVGNTLRLAIPDWLVFLAGFGSVVLTFLAGAEVDPTALARSWRASLLIGSLSFAAPFAVAMLTCRYLAGWDWRAAQIGGIALSTTSLAVVYALLVETGLSASRIGQLRHHLGYLRVHRGHHHPRPVLRAGLRRRGHRGAAHRHRPTLLRPAPARRE